MATARKKARATGRIPGVVRLAPKPAAMEVLVFEDNGGRYRWTIVAASGEQLAESPAFASYEDARDAAVRVRDGAGSARLGRDDAADVPIDLSSRRGAAARDDSDVDRWLDEGGAYSAAVAVAVQLPPPR